MYGRVYFAFRGRRMREVNRNVCVLSFRVWNHSQEALLHFVEECQTQFFTFSTRCFWPERKPLSVVYCEQQWQSAWPRWGREWDSALGSFDTPGWRPATIQPDNHSTWRQKKYHFVFPVGKGRGRRNRQRWASMFSNFASGAYKTLQGFYRHLFISGNSSIFFLWLKLTSFNYPLWKGLWSIKALYKNSIHWLIELCLLNMKRSTLKIVFLEELRVAVVLDINFV